MLIITKSVRLVTFPNPYITTGLVAQWDGEWNAGPGLHDTHATTWADLAENCPCAAQGEAPIWTSNAFDGNLKTYFCGNSTVLGQLIRDGTFTFELVIHYRESGLVNNTQGFFGVMNGSVRCFNPFWRWSTNWYTSYRGAETPMGICPLTIAALYTLTILSNGQTFINGTPSPTLRVGSSTVIGNTITLGAFGLNPIVLSTDYATASLIHSIRFYNRILTPAERAVNLETDQIRFNH